VFFITMGEQPPLNAPYRVWGSVFLGNNGSPWSKCMEIYLIKESPFYFMSGGALNKYFERWTPLLIKRS
jgi:hypothetical protein